jgi:thiamine-monophosphate kinase
MSLHGRRTIAEIGEQWLVERIQRVVRRSAVGDVAAIGDDAAILPTPRGKGHPTVVSTDVLVEGTHWRTNHLTPAQLARRALVANLSDLAAMAAEPRWFTLGLAMPPTQSVAWFQGLLRGLMKAADEFRCPLIGGDLVRAPVVSIAITVCGQCHTARPARRDAARPGDTVCLTGDIGRARLALEVLDGRCVPQRGQAKIVAKHRRPVPRLAEAAALARGGTVRAMIDLSDGLISDIGWICRLSGVGAEIDLAALPVSPEVNQCLSGRGGDSAAWAASSGEEFELLLTTRRRIESLRALLDAEGIRTPITPIGHITSGRRVKWTRNGKTVTAPRSDLFRHFSQG